MASIVLVPSSVTDSLSFTGTPVTGTGQWQNINDLGFGDADGDTSYCYALSDPGILDGDLDIVNPNGVVGPFIRLDICVEARTMGESPIDVNLNCSIKWTGPLEAYLVHVGSLTPGYVKYVHTELGSWTLSRLGDATYSLNLGYAPSAYIRCPITAFYVKAYDANAEAVRVFEKRSVLRGTSRGVGRGIM